MVPKRNKNLHFFQVKNFFDGNKPEDLQNETRQIGKKVRFFAKEEDCGSTVFCYILSHQNFWQLKYQYFCNHFAHVYIQIYNDILS